MAFLRSTDVRAAAAVLTPYIPSHKKVYRPIPTLERREVSEANRAVAAVNNPFFEINKASYNCQ
jgi:hypothetical protein